MKPLEHLRKLPGVVAVALVDLVEQRQLAVGGTEQGVTDLPEVVASLFVLAPGRQKTAGVKGIQEGVEIGAVVADRKEVDLLAIDDVLDQIVPDCGCGLGLTESMWSQKRCEAKADWEAEGRCRRRTVWENQTHIDRLLRGLIARLIAAIARY